MRSSAEDAAALLQRDVGFDGDSVGSDHRPVGAALALDLTALCIASRTCTDTQRGERERERGRVRERERPMH